MPNKPIAELISARLTSGLLHPGDPETNQPAITLALPVFRTAGMPKEMIENISLTVRLIGEAIVHLIETDGASVIVPHSDLAELRVIEAKATGDGIGPQTMPVHCRCDHKLSDPLMLLTVGNQPRIVVDGKQLISGLSKRAIECPHEVKK